MSEIVLTKIDVSNLSALETWFQDSELQTRLGGMLPLEQYLNLVHTTPNRETWMAYVKNTPVGLVDLEFYSDNTASISLLVNPELRNCGYGRKILNTALSQPEVATLKVIEAMTEADNAASLRCFKSIGFIEQFSEPDEEGFLKLVYFI